MSCPPFKNADQVIGAVIRAARLEMDRPLVTVAAMVGISHQQLQKYESGSNRVAVSRFIELAHALDIDPGLLFNRCLAGLPEAAAMSEEGGKLAVQTSELVALLRRLPTPQARQRLIEHVGLLGELIAAADGKGDKAG